MQGKVSGFFKHTAVYSLGNLIYRGAAFLLIPLYAHYMSAAEYGKLELIVVTAAIIQTVLGAGIAHAAMRYYFEYDLPKDRAAVVSSALIASFTAGMIGAGGLCLLAPWISRLVLGSAAYAGAFRVVFISLVFELSREISLSLVRAKEKSTFFIGVSLLQLLVQVAANWYTVTVLKIGVLGVVTGNLAATLAVWMLLSRFAIKECGIRFSWEKLKPALQYGRPLMLTGLVSPLLQSMDRYFLKAYSTLATVGFYALGLRFANIIPILVILPFTNSYGPFRLSIMKQPNAPRVYARMLSYCVLLTSMAFLGILAVSEVTIRLASAPEYWPAYRLIPLLIIPGALSGVNYCFQSGILLQKRTGRIFYLTTGCNLCNLLVVWLLVPWKGVYGAAIAGVVTSVLGTTATYFVAQQLYPIPYEFKRMFKVALSVGLLGAAIMMIDLPNIWVGLVVKLFIAGLFPFAVLVLRAISADEIDAIKRFVGKLCSSLPVVKSWAPAAELDPASVSEA